MGLGNEAPCLISVRGRGCLCCRNYKDLVDPNVAGTIQAIEGDEAVNRYTKFAGDVCAGIVSLHCIFKR